MKIKLKKPKAKTVVLTCILVAGAAFGGYKVLGPKPEPIVPVSAVAVASTDLQSAVSATGSVLSADSMNVYAKVNEPVNELHVQVGDRVSAGDILCELDTEDLKLSIEENKANLRKASASAQFQIEATQKKFDNVQGNIENGLDASLTSAEAQVKATKEAMDQAREDHDDAKDKYDKACDDYDVDKDDDDSSDLTIGASMTLRELRNDRDAALQRYESARVSYQNAVKARQVAENGAGQELDSYLNQIAGSKIDADTAASQIALKKLEKQLGECSVAAPIDGTVTAVYAKQGAPATGLMFVIESTDSLIVKTKLKEYDMAAVTEGMPVTVKSDATGEKEFAGKVTRIYPTALKAEDGSTKTDGSAQFETEIALDGGHEGLRIGMNVRLNIITAKKENVWAVPFDAVTTGADGQQIVYVTRTDETGKVTAQPVTVSTGMETDFYIEITSPDLKEGDQVIGDPSSITSGVQVLVAGGAAGAAGGGAAAAAAAVG